jgi:iron-sulfur cluster assembly protein
MLVLTSDAAEAIKGLTEVPDTDGLRISAVPSSDGSPGFGLQLALAPEPAPEDEVVETEDARVFLDPPAARALDDKVLDADVEAGEVRFSLGDQ